MSGNPSDNGVVIINFLQIFARITRKLSLCVAQENFLIGEVVAKLVELCSQGKAMEALETLYAENIVM